MVVYADTSFLFSFYTNDANSVQAREEGSKLASRASIAFTALQQHELHNALWLSVFRKTLTPRQSSAIKAFIAADIQSGVLVEYRIDWEEAYALAEKLGEIHTPTIGCRASDILHVALAQMIGVEQFYSFDIRQRDLAKKVGLIAIPHNPTLDH
jgi:predicted nucleic acid-binding protein